MEKIVENCNDCPFCGMGGYEGEYSQCNAKQGKEIPATKKLFGNIVKVPKWCPIRSVGILVKLNKANVISKRSDP
jgi:hypothetical protein